VLGGSGGAGMYYWDAANCQFSEGRHAPERLTGSINTHGGPIQVVSEELMFNSLTLHRIDSSFHQAMNWSQFMFMTLILLFTMMNLPFFGKKV